MNDPDLKLLLALLLATGVAGALWYFRDDILPAAPEPVAVQPAPAAGEVPVPQGPKYPLAPFMPTESGDRELVPLPPLNDSDSYFLLALIDAFGPDVERILVHEALIDKCVATIDNLARKHVAERIRPVGRLPQAFRAEAADTDGYYYLSRDNYERYDALVNLVSRAKLEDLAAMYRRFYPLLQKSYEGLGYPNAYFNDRVVEVIDLLLATPEPDEPVLLVRPNVLYEYADAELEALSSGQKLLLRMGGDNAAAIKEALQGLRALIVESPQ